MADFRSSPRLIHLLVSALICVHVVLLLTVLRAGATLKRPAPQSSWTVGVFHDVAHTSGPGADLFALYHAGVNACRGLSVYETGEYPRVTPYFYPYRYLPITAHTLGRALAALTARSAYVVWALVIELTVVLVTLALRRASADAMTATGVTAILLLSAPYWLELYMGQFTMVATSLTCLAVLGWTMRPHSWRSAWMALFLSAVLLKVFPLVTLPAFLTKRAGIMLSVVTVAIVVGTNLPLFLADPASIDAFWSKNFIGEPVGLDAGNHGVLYVVFLSGQLLYGEWNLPLWGALTIVWRAAVLGGTAVTILRARDLPLQIGASTLLLAHFVSYFQVWEHHISGAIVAGLLLCVGLERGGRLRQSRIALAATATLALPTPFAWLPADPTAWNWLDRLLPALSKAVPLLILFGTALWVAAWSGREGPTGDAPRRMT